MFLGASLLALMPTVFLQETEQMDIATAQKTLAELEAELGDSHLDLVNPLAVIAQVYFEEGRYERAAETLHRVLSIEEGALGANHLDLSGTLYTLAICRRYQGLPEEACALLERSLAIMEESLGAEHPNVAYLLSLYAEVLGSLEGGSRNDEATRAYERALEIFTKSSGLHVQECSF